MLGIFSSKLGLVFVMVWLSFGGNVAYILMQR